MRNWILKSLIHAPCFVINECMHQTFYIDADEEISSVIDRLNKSVSADNYFVVPKRAIFLQSIVNLKLLKREAEKTGKRLIIVTQDEIGASMAERCGLSVKPSVEGLDVAENEPTPYVEESVYEMSPEEIDEFEDKKNRLSGIGSKDFYDAAVSSSKKNIKASANVKSQTRIPVKSSSDMKNVRSNKVAERQAQESAYEPKKSTKSFYGNKIDPYKEKTLEKMYSVGNKPLEKESTHAVSEVSGLAKKIFMAFAGLCFLIFAGVAVYLFLPSANIMISPNVLEDKIDMVIYGNTEVSQVEEKTMPVRIIDKEEKISLAYNVAENGSGAGKKARGNVALYNEYSNSPQTLIATTRIESEGKIFRLTKNVVVPGTTTVSGETKPGVIEAEVVADQPGEDFNIAPTSFKIPGFKDGPKYEKFYAKSTENFEGGTSEGAGESGSVTQRDIDNAKQKTEVALKEKIMKTVSDELKEGEIVLTPAEKITITKVGADAKIGDVTGTFNYNATASIRAIVFSENDVKSIIEQLMKEKNLKDSNWNISKVEYGTSVADFDKNTLELKIHGEIAVIPIIDIEKIKGELLGKKDDELGSVLKNYASIKSVNVEFQPTIVSRIPQYSQ
ncbi:MAG: hypothetical protein ACD_9C00013G0001, partial [uncultured bacterium]